MSAGTPTGHLHNHRLQRHAHTQAIEIHALLARNVPARDVAAAVGCTLDRVRQVARQPVPDPSDGLPGDVPASALPTPRQGDDNPPAARTGGQHPSWDTTLNRMARHDDRRLRALADHIRADLNTGLLLLAAADRREKATAEQLAADRQAEAARRLHDQRHPSRRRTDQPTGAAS